MKIYKNAAAAEEILRRGRFDDEEKSAAVRSIVRDVRARGDAALFEYCEKFDGSVLGADTVAADRNDKVAAFRQCGVIFAERDVFILPAVLFVHECFRTVFLQNRQNFPGVCVRIAFIQIWNHRNFHKPQSFLSSAA